MNIVEFLKTKDVEFELLPHRDTYDAQRMAQELHVPGREVAKTVLLRSADEHGCLVAVLPANRQIDFAKAAEELGSSQVELATELEMSEHCPDCEIGALPPFGSPYGMNTVIDADLAEDDEIVFEGNTHHEAIRMKFDDYCDIEKPIIASLTR